MSDDNPLSLACPVPAPAGAQILLAHGEGAGLTRRLIRELLLRELDNPYLRLLGDGAVLPPVEGALVVTTDSSVVSPLFFPGGDIGKLAVHSAINDLAVSGAEPLYLTLALILEEGLPLATLQRVVKSVAEAACACRIPIVTGDTKVVARGQADQLYLTTTGVGRLRPGVELGARRIQPGDVILVSGPLADHGLAILAARENLGFEPPPQSDTAPVHELVAELLTTTEVHFLRDPTRGGVSAVLHELVEATGFTMIVDEANLPLSDCTRGVCELLGLDPLHIANEGKVVAVVAANATDRALQALQAHPLGRHAAVIGRVTGDRPPAVLVRSNLGQLRRLEEPRGSPLPRIC